MGVTHLPDIYKDKFNKTVITIPLNSCLKLVSSVIDNPYNDQTRYSIEIYRGMVIKILIRYLIHNRGTIPTTNDIIELLSKLYAIDTTIYYNHMYNDCFYYVVGMFNSLIRMYKIVDVIKVEVRNDVVILTILTRD